METTTSATKSASPTTSATPAPRSRLVRILAFQPSRLPTQDPETGNVRFELQVVNMMSRLDIFACTKECWQKHKSLRPDLDKKSEFHLSLEPGTKTVFDFSKAAPPNTSGFQEAGADGNPVSQKLVIHQWPDGAFSPESVPERFSTATVESVLAELSKVGQVTQGMTLGNRFFVTGAQNQPNGTFISIEVNG